ncbi:hypothetical protein AY599_04930 [Leptolyngbya valderiana BDU 20041]|nr:hypothetical protein AY599_04930 [Leptolyngbya valderiana BDU 20041]
MAYWHFTRHDHEFSMPESFTRAGVLAGLLLLTITAILPSTPTRASEDGEEHGLVENMGAMQYFSHKLVLAIDAGNLPLADFYAHELEETIEAASAIESYGGQAIGALVDSMLEPRFEELEDALDSDVDRASAAFDAMVDSCNACHQATGFGLIRIQRRSDNPWLQDFSPQD